jgi:hypothetical protein
VPKVQHKPIKSPRKGSNKKSKRQPKAALVWRTGLSGVPPDSVRCTRENHSELATFGNLGSHSAIIHWTVRCSTGLSGVPVEQWLNVPTVVCKSLQWTMNSANCARRVRAGAKWRTGQWTGPVRCTTGLSGGPHVRSSNGQTLTVGWRGWRTEQCLVHPSTADFPNDHFGGWGYKYPPTTTLQGTQAFTTPHLIQEQYTTLQDTNQSLR